MPPGGRYRGIHKPPSHNSKTVDKTESSWTTFSVTRPAKSCGNYRLAYPVAPLNPPGGLPGITPVTTAVTEADERSQYDGNLSGLSRSPYYVRGPVRPVCLPRLSIHVPGRSTGTLPCHPREPPRAKPLYAPVDLWGGREVRPGRCHRAERRLEIWPETPILPKQSFSYRRLSVKQSVLQRNTCSIMPYTTGIRLLGIAQNPADSFPARLLGPTPYHCSPRTRLTGPP